MKTFTRNTLVLCTITVLACMLAACATQQSRKTSTTTFLGDYSMLKEGGDGRALLYYINPAADFKAYKTIMMDPVRLYASGKHEMDKLTPEDRQRILNYADAALRKQLGVDYKLVSTPGPGVMRVRVAITEAEDSNVTLDTISTIVPIGLALNSLAALATGEWGFTGSAGLEVELLDSVSGRRLAAAVDRRTGGKISGQGDKFDDWRTIQSALDYWANQMRVRLAEERAK
jgi:Protein of unknown function (DUF3313)